MPSATAPGAPGGRTVPECVNHFMQVVLILKGKTLVSKSAHHQVSTSTASSASVARGTLQFVY